MQKGFSTIELMIAMAILVLVLSAVVVVSFSNQSYLIGSETNAEAMRLAQGLLEEEQALGRKDFNLVNPRSAVAQGVYSKTVHVTLLPDYLTKEVKALVSWTGERGQNRSVELNTLITNFETPLGGDTCDSTIKEGDDWANPKIERTIDFSNLGGIPDGTYTLTDVDAYKNKLYVTAGRAADPDDSSNKGLPTFFVFDVSDPDDPELEGEVDNASGVIMGLNAVHVSESSAQLKTYAYTASNTSSDYSICDPKTDPACGQLVLFDVTSPTNPKWETNLKIESPAVTGLTTGESIFYKNGYLLLGLAKADGPEFHVIDMHNPSVWLGSSHLVYSSGSFEIDIVIKALAMRGAYAYLGTPNSKELQILNLSNPSSPDPVGEFSGASTGNGESIYLVGDNLYFGKTSSLTGPEFYILDASNPETVLPDLGSEEINASVNEVIVRDYLAFLLTNNELKIYRIDDPANIALQGSLSLSSSGSSTKPSMDCEGNRLFITSNNGSGAGFLYVVKPN